jgi:ribonucleoside-diphosphate reductase alpha chain
MTNVSVNYDTEWLMNYWQSHKVSDTFLANCHQAMKTGEPGFSFNFFDKETETGRNACTEISTSDDSDVCNLGSLNFSRITSLSELKDVVELATKFLICGTLRAELPYDKVYKIREKNRRLGLGIMGLHEWLIQRGYKYEMVDELKKWFAVYRSCSRGTADRFSSQLDISNPVACRAIAPTGSIGIIAGTTTGIEPIYAIAIKRRYLKGTTWKYQYVIDGAAKDLIDRYGINPDYLESSIDLAKDYERRIKFQADVQDYVDMSISSTINLPKWDTEYNHEGLVKDFANTLASYAHRLRGFTVYPDGARGGQPLVSVPYHEAIDRIGVELEENTEVFDVCDITGTGFCSA